MRLRSTVLTAAAVLVALALTGCGGDPSATADSSPSGTTSSPGATPSAPSTQPSEEPSGSPTSESGATGIPPGVGPVLTVGTDFPYTVQALGAGTRPEILEQTAPAGKTILALTVVIKSGMSDRGVPSPNLSGGTFAFPKTGTCRPAAEGGCYTLLTTSPIVTAKDALADPKAFHSLNSAVEHVSKLESGQSYYAVFWATVPEQLKPASVTLTYGGKTLPLKGLPDLLPSSWWRP